MDQPVAAWALLYGLTSRQENKPAIFVPVTEISPSSIFCTAIREHIFHNCQGKLDFASIRAKKGDLLDRQAKLTVIFQAVSTNDVTTIGVMDDFQTVLFQADGTRIRLVRRLVGFGSVRWGVRWRSLLIATFGLMFGIVVRHTA